MGTLSRRQFLRSAAGAGCALLAAGLLPLPGTGSGESHAAPSPLDELLRTAPRARFWSPVPGGEGAVRCALCAHGCTIPPGGRGRCRARMNAGGELRSLVYGRPLSVHVDPIEKKPFYHFLPGAAAFSFGTAGCPLRCAFCQNWQISQAAPEEREGPYVPADRMAGMAAGKGAPVIAFTYNEATVFTEYLLDTASRARSLGIRPVLVSCGFMNEAPLSEMLSVLDAVKIDLKGYSPDFYRKVCEAELAPVLRSIRQVARSGRHLEIVNLVVPGLNDSGKMLSDLSAWVASEAGPDVPLHFTRFHPDYRMRNLPPTPVSTLERAREEALARGVRHAYVGNVPGHAGNHTYCPGCGKAVIVRNGFFVSGTHLPGGKCEYCRRPVAGVWS